MVEKEKVKPLAPSIDQNQTVSDDEDTVYKKTTRPRKYVKWLSCIVASIIHLAVVVVILIFMVFKIKEPEIKMNDVMVNNFDFMNGSILQPGTSISLTIDISVKNPNFASFRYKNTTTNLYYRGVVIGVARGPPGQSKARRTTRMNITMDIMVDRLFGNPNLQSDISTGLLSMSSYTIVGGRVKLLTIIKKQVTVSMNCTMKVNIISRAIEDQMCKRKVKI
ncbi:late embryogenesis abundant protein At1g64065 [Lactuca sativa]|uniref:Late embryogenesis abundant protein LEA-2 subgroup domain-containing protein n=1 Tax=Lactuca sativa TaxID=4236 RepID=A0A9R1VWN7_LACSA|nr:late embryogenesis abundant protein At1g64065 [Lactuca sativa]KAJ0213976.1 hypothetical protein LSAT_V11C400170580 [Lactuca sativa]